MRLADFKSVSSVLPLSATSAASPSLSARVMSSRVSAKSVSSLRVVVTSLSTRVRSRSSFCAAAASFQSSGFSAAAFSSACRLTRFSQSKTPLQHGERVLELVGDGVSVEGHYWLYKLLEPAGSFEDDWFCDKDNPRALG
jgi:hypothetical protein